MTDEKRLELIQEAKDIKPGVCVRIGYTSDVPVKAEHKRNGVVIKKIVSTTGRIGVKYKNIKKVQERVAANATRLQAGTNNYTWIIENKIKHNSNTNKDYLQIATFPEGDHTKVCYEVNDKGICKYYFSKDELRKSYAGKYVRNSYFDKKSATEVYAVNLENVFRLRNFNA